MNRYLTICAALFLLASLAEPMNMPAQQPFAERFTSHNRTMSSRQPTFITPLVGVDPRLVQYTKFSVSHQYTAVGTETTNYGNNRGTGVIVGDRFEFDFIAPPYISSTTARQTMGLAIPRFWRSIALPPEMLRTATIKLRLF